jgi:LAO/AO transport system kinase
MIAIPGSKTLQLKDRIRAALDGDMTAIARLLTLVETAGSVANETHEAIFPHTGKAHIIGITGPAGAGKSTLISKLAASLARGDQTRCDQKVAIIACDPSSPVSGGALLGDRIRMHDLVANEQIFVRSIATRDSTGGLPLAAFRAADVFDACGYERIIIETVGTGQNQTDIMQAAHTVISVSAPGLGDDIQAMKSGLLELADIHAVTKSDLAGAAKALMDIENAVHMRLKDHDGSDAWIPAVLPLNGLNGDGIADLHKAIQTHFKHLQDTGNMQQRCQRMFRERIYREAVNVLAQSFRSAPDKRLADRIDQVMQRELTPAQAAREILD